MFSDVRSCSPRLLVKVSSLLHAVERLLPPCGGPSVPFGFVSPEELSSLQRDIHRRIVELSTLRGSNAEEEALLCLALLSGYSVSMYGNPEDETGRESALLRSHSVLSALPSSSLKERLSGICSQYS